MGPLLLFAIVLGKINWYMQIGFYTCSFKIFLEKCNRFHFLEIKF